jgi:hypothetical protein
VFHKYGDVFFWRIDYRLSLRDGPSGFLRASGRGDGTPFPQGERPTTLAGHPEEARCGRAVSKDQGKRIRKRIYEMLYLVMHEKVLQVGIAIRRQDPDRQTTMPRTSCETLGNQGS